LPFSKLSKIKNKEKPLAVEDVRDAPCPINAREENKQ
jgi:hypothetical protein